MNLSDEISSAMNQKSSEYLPHYRVRPRFKMETNYPIDHWEDKIKSGLLKEDATCNGKVSPGFVTLSLPIEEQHYWSPQLTVSIEETENGSILRGLYAPRPTVWTMFVFFYSIIGFTIMAIGVIGLSNLSLNKPGSILWYIPGLVLIFISLYLVAFFGQRMARNQMITLHQFLEKSTGLVLNDPSFILEPK